MEKKKIALEIQCKNIISKGFFTIGKPLLGVLIQLLMQGDGEVSWEGWQWRLHGWPQPATSPRDLQMVAS